jgi:hypothetical protein
MSSTPTTPNRTFQFVHLKPRNTLISFSSLSSSSNYPSFSSSPISATSSSSSRFTPTSSSTSASTSTSISSDSHHFRPRPSLHQPPTKSFSTLSPPSTLSIFQKQSHSSQLKDNTISPSNSSPHNKPHESNSDLSEKETDLENSIILTVDEVEINSPYSDHSNTSDDGNTVVMKKKRRRILSRFEDDEIDEDDEDEIDEDKEVEEAEEVEEVEDEKFNGRKRIGRKLTKMCEKSPFILVISSDEESTQHSQSFTKSSQKVVENEENTSQSNADEEEAIILSEGESEYLHDYLLSNYQQKTQFESDFDIERFYYHFIYFTHYIYEKKVIDLL